MTLERIRILRHTLDILFHYKFIGKDEFIHMSEKVAACPEKEFKFYEKHYEKLYFECALKHGIGRR